MNDWSGKTGDFTPNLQDKDYVAQLKSAMETRVKSVKDFGEKAGGFDKLPDEALAALEKIVKEIETL
jgi:phosphoenolpyruvate carboxykinase (ATP)